LTDITQRICEEENYRFILLLSPLPTTLSRLFLLKQIDIVVVVLFVQKTAEEEHWN
jgi:hypothetical protein